MTPETDPLSLPVFALDAAAKHAALHEALVHLTHHHVENCREYGSIIDALWGESRSADRIEDLPWLPVRLFKLMDLRSVPEKDVLKTLVSSGTTGAAVSRIHLDAATAKQQTRALARIFSEFAGNRRMRMLVIDDDGFLRDRTRFNARAAGILGFSTFGRDPLFLLDSHLEPDWERLAYWLASSPDDPVFVFGFTFVVWQCFVEKARAQGRRFRLPDGSILVHGGGWKKLEERKVSNDDFKRALLEVAGIRRVHNYYGMVEQVGSVFFECEHGRLHAPAYADVVIRDSRTLAPLPAGKEGLVQVLSALPRSYPGHSILTEDRGLLLGEDDCACGRLGKTFAITGRIPNVEVRGCSDTRMMPRQ